MAAELSTVWLAARAIAKLSITTGFGPWLVICSAVHIGRTYRVAIAGSVYGEFIGRCIGIGSVGRKRFVQILVTDTLRPSPRVRNRCPFPECLGSAYHGGDHEFPRIRKDTYVDVPEREASFVEIETGAA